MNQSVIWRVIVVILLMVGVSACAGSPASSNIGSGIGGTVWVADEQGNSITVIVIAHDEFRKMVLYPA